MLYVGLTENHRDSATLFANVVGAQVISQLTGANYRTDLAAAKVGDANNDVSLLLINSLSLLTVDPLCLPDKKVRVSITFQMTTGKLMQIYEKCIPNLRSSQSQRRTNSLKNIQPANFTKKVLC